jgi:hypothetical protein
MRRRLACAYQVYILECALGARAHSLRLKFQLTVWREDKRPCYFLSQLTHPRYSPREAVPLDAAEIPMS